MPQESPSRKLDQYIVRFPEGLRSRVKEAAAENNRSLNAEIIARLELSFEQENAKSSQDNAFDQVLKQYADLQSKLDEIEKRMK